MNWLAKINFSIVIQRFGPYRSALLLVLIIIICVFGGYRMGNYYHGYQIKTLSEQKQRLDELYQQQSEQVSRINTLDLELEVEKLANIDALNTLKSMEIEHYQVKTELAFYEKVMAPEKQANGLVIDNTIIVATESPNHFRFQVVLVQQQLKKINAQGHVQLTFIGSLNGKPSKIELSDISPQTEKALAFSFKYFQLINGEFTFPDGFVPEQIDVSAIMPKGKWQKYSRLDQNYPWPLSIEKQFSSDLITDGTVIIKPLETPQEKDKVVILD